MKIIKTLYLLDKFSVVTSSDEFADLVMILYCFLFTLIDRIK